MFRAYHIKYTGDVYSSNLFMDDTFNDVEGYSLIDPKLKIEIGKAGSFVFKLPISNIEYDNFEDLVSYVDLYRNDELIFSGRVFGLGPKDFYGKTTVSCEGLLALFNDSIFEPITFNGTLSELLTTLLDSHNSQVETHKQVYLGNVTVVDEYVYRAYENYESTMSRLADIVDSYGGYMSVRKQEDGSLVLDYISEFTEVSDQTIDFGENLLDVQQSTDVSELYTVLYPFGASVTDDETGETSQINIASVNNDKLYVENEDGIEKYGRIAGVMDWSDVTVPSILKTKAINYLAKICTPKVIIDITAVDMAKAGSDINYFKPGINIPIRSSFHNINRTILVRSQELSLNNPANNSMVLSDVVIGYIGKTNKNITAINNNVNYVTTKSEELSVESADLRSEIRRINEAGFINSDGAAGIFSNLITEYDGTVNDKISASLVTVNGTIQALIEENNRLKKYLRFDENGLVIGAAESTVYSIQDEDSYRYVDSSGNVTLFEINTAGVIADTYDVKKQVSFSEGDMTQWAIRKGAVDGNGKFNLNDVWIGG